jgi:hypothetical protein
MPDSPAEPSEYWIVEQVGSDGRWRPYNDYPPFMNEFTAEHTQEIRGSTCRVCRFISAPEATLTEKGNQMEESMTAIDALAEIIVALGETGDEEYERIQNAMRIATKALVAEAKRNNGIRSVLKP